MPPYPTYPLLFIYFASFACLVNPIHYLNIEIIQANKQQLG